MCDHTPQHPARPTGKARAGWIVTCALVALVGCTSDVSTNGQSASAAPAADAEQGFEKVVRDTLPSVVEITTGDGLGSGVLYDDQGHIVTNAHVVGTATTFDISFAADSSTRKGKLVATYPPDDLAVVKVDGDLPASPARFGDSGAVQVGQLVLAMGNPLGLSSSVSSGIVSALGRTVSEEASLGSPGATITDMIQTSAPINPGNSGGALVDMSGAVIGIPTLAATDSRQGGAAPGIGFAVSSDTVKRIADQIIKDGKVTQSGRAALDITARTVVNTERREAGAGVVSVENDGAAQRAGIKAGDVITRFDDTDIPTVAALSQALADHKPDDKVKLTVVRGDSGNTDTVEVTLGEL